MKNFYFTLFIALFSTLSYSQEATPALEQRAVALPSEDAIYNTAGIEVKPEYPGGMQEFYNYIGKNYRTPKVPGLKGKIFVAFVVEKDGSITDIKVLRDIGHGTGKEAVRVLKSCKKWIPGEQFGKKVRVLYSLPINIE